MFNLETINLFTKKRNQTQEDMQARIKAREELKKYECFNNLLNTREELFKDCKNVILQEILTITRSNTKINRDYLIGYQDALDVFLRNLEKYRVAVEKLS